MTPTVTLTAAAATAMSTATASPTKPNVATIVGIILGVLGCATVLCYIATKFFSARARARRAGRASNLASAPVVTRALPHQRMPFWLASPASPATDDVEMHNLDKFCFRPSTPLLEWNVPRTVLVYEPTDEANHHRKSLTAPICAAQDHAVAFADVQVPQKVFVTNSTVPKHAAVTTSKAHRPRSSTNPAINRDGLDSKASMTWQQHQNLGRSDSRVTGIKRARTLAKLEGSNPDSAEVAENRKRAVAAKSSAHRLSDLALLQTRAQAAVDIPLPLQIGRKVGEADVQRVLVNAYLRAELPMHGEETQAPVEMPLPLQIRRKVGEGDVQRALVDAYLRTEVHDGETRAKRSSFLDAVLDAGELEPELTLTYA